MQPLANEKALIAKAKAGKKDAISTLYEYYAQRIFQYIRYRVASTEIAEDLTAEVFLRMVRDLPKYNDHGAPFGAWLYRMAAHRLADHYRQAKVMEEISLDYSADGPSLLENLVSSEEQESIQKALKQLPPDYQNLLILRFVQELSHNEISYIMGKSEGALRIMQHRALKALAETMKTLELSQTFNGNQEKGDKDV